MKLRWLVLGIAVHVSACATGQPVSNKAAQPLSAGGDTLESTQSRADVSVSRADTPSEKSVAQARQPAKQDVTHSDPPSANGDDTDNNATEASSGELRQRVRVERQNAFNPYVLTAHKHNFILPVSYSSGLNEAIYVENDVPLREGLQPAEVKFQISLKSQVNEDDLLFKNDTLSLGITLEAWWQLYSSDLSSPFRETNYQPEIFYLVPLDREILGGYFSFVAGLEHQSNGQVQGLSRSWNRLYTALVYERGRLVTAIRPWYRIPEKEKENPGDAKGDDNPDIIDFMGHGDISGSWRYRENEIGVLVRGNPSTGKGAIRVGMTFPLFARFRGFVEFFSGYGDSLIDYNHYQQRLGIGVALSRMY